MKREASCSCGALRVTCSGEPERISICHCIACQKQTGSLFGIGAFFALENIAVQGAHTGYSRPSDAGFEVVFHFCGTCGSTVFWEPERMPGLVGVGVGSFGDPGFPAPQQEVHTESRHRWVGPLAPDPA